MRQKHQSHLPPLGRSSDFSSISIVHVCTIIELYRQHVPAHHVSDTNTGSQGTFHVSALRPTTTPDSGVRDQCPPPRRQIWVSFCLASLWRFTPCDNIISFFSLMVPNQAHDKSTQQSSGARSAMTLPVSIPNQFAVSMSSHSRWCRHLQSSLHIADLDRTLQLAFRRY